MPIRESGCGLIITSVSCGSSEAIFVPALCHLQYCLVFSPDVRISAPSLLTLSLSG
jgi:hypothetical protein